MADNTDQVYVSLEFTPNPSTLKYVVNRTLLKTGAANFKDLESAQKSPLAQKLFGITGVVGVMIGRDFVTVTKGEAGDWETLNRESTNTIKEHLTAGLPVVDKDYMSGHAASSEAGRMGEIEDKIRQILDEKIRPAVAMDGGDITFDRFENGVVFLHLQGSCSGCPSSTATLKMGIETRLKEAIPEVVAVESV
jgi:Fe-S cluster biogenesis protein NfuA